MRGDSQITSLHHLCHLQRVSALPRSWRQAAFHLGETVGGIPRPALRANPFPEVTDLSCRLPLPTLLNGPEAANLGDLMRFLVRSGMRVNQSLGISRTKLRLSVTMEARRPACSAATSPVDLLPWQAAVSKERKHMLGLCAALPMSITSPASARTRAEEYLPLSLSEPEAIQSFQDFSTSLESTYPCPNTVHMETFSTSVFKVPV